MTIQQRLNGVFLSRAQAFVAQLLMSETSQVSLIFPFFKHVCLLCMDAPLGRPLRGDAPVWGIPTRRGAGGIPARLLHRGAVLPVTLSVRVRDVLEGK